MFILYCIKLYYIKYNIYYVYLHHHLTAHFSCPARLQARQLCLHVYVLGLQPMCCACL